MGMPMGDWFGQDINTTPIRGIYPTASGGTSANAAGAMTMAQNIVTNAGDATVANVSSSTVKVTGNGVYWWVGFVALFAVLVFAAREVGGEEDFRNIRPTFYNFMTITLTSILGIVGLKVIAAKWHVPGASDIILAA